MLLSLLLAAAATAVVGGCALLPISTIIQVSPISPPFTNPKSLDCSVLCDAPLERKADHTKHAPLGTTIARNPKVAPRPKLAPPHSGIGGRARHSFQESQARCLIARHSDTGHPDNPWGNKNTRPEPLEVIALLGDRRWPCRSEPNSPRPASPHTAGTSKRQRSRASDTGSPTFVVHSRVVRWLCAHVCGFALWCPV
ncbi:hypothetical protein QBC40DRAFT_41796 [Triangularia verruculosa]|uniref:Uncharacterized protein n=1 Tax=Triangularia verruculosa TaxID=2587418 RepID=A0AAN6X4W2_9PEZI|nr:hypothetical protein QBC40DRAFT_41796 [Triangularia verruculosa]